VEIGCRFFVFVFCVRSRGREGEFSILIFSSNTISLPVLKTLSYLRLIQALHDVLDVLDARQGVSDVAGVDGVDDGARREEREERGRLGIAARHRSCRRPIGGGGVSAAAARRQRGPLLLLLIPHLLCARYLCASRRGGLKGRVKWW